MNRYFCDLDADTLLSVLLLLSAIILSSILGPAVYSSIKEQEAKTYLAYVELPTGEVKTYEVDNVSCGIDACTLFLEDGRKVKVTQDRVVLEELPPKDV